MNTVELVSKGHGKKNVHRNEIMFCCLILRNIINVRSVLESAEKCRENWKDQCEKSHVKYSTECLSVCQKKS